MPASLLFRNGTILTMDPARPRVEALAVGGGRILAAGSLTEARAFAGPGTRVVDLGRRCLLPAFVDAHTHLTHFGLDLSRLDLSQARSLRSALASLRVRAARAKPGAWIVAHSFDETRWPENRLPTRADLDAVAPNRKVLLRRVDGHSAVVSSAALVRLDLRGVEGVERKAGVATGVLREDAADRAYEAARATREEVDAGLRRGARRLHAMGVASVAETSEAWEARAYRRHARSGRPLVRAYLKARESLLDEALARGTAGDAWIRWGGVKLYLDGSFGSHTAALSEPFADAPDVRGLLTYSDARLRSIARRAHAGGLQLCMHAIGDRAIDQALAAAADAQRSRARADARHRIEHFLLPSQDAIERARRLGVVASVQPNFLGRWGGKDGLYERRLGVRRASRLLPLRDMADAGVRIALGSDGMPYGPLFGIHSAVNARYPRQRLTVDEALRAYTADAAWACHAEDRVGSLSPGKLADLVVLSRDPREDPTRIDRLSAVATYLDGKLVHGAVYRRLSSQRSARSRP
ncbi:MAG TPA: amidohydrolase [Candidatus Thermoplasmatota archaeon]|nr:amidohydrolase [Candidatus Thermoplasmatota archaeon]